MGWRRIVAAGRVSWVPVVCSIKNIPGVTKYPGDVGCPRGHMHLLIGRKISCCGTYLVSQNVRAACGAVRCGAVRCGAVRCGAVRCGAVRCGAVRCGAVRCGAVRCGAVRCNAT